MIYGGHAIFTCPIYFLQGHMTFCGIFHKVKDMPTGPINILLRDMPRVIPQVLEYRECERYIMISFCRHATIELRSVPHEVHLQVHFWWVVGERETRVEESAAIARVRVMAMLSTYSDLEDQLNSDDLESEVERGSNFKKKTTPSTAKHCPFIFLL